MPQGISLHDLPDLFKGANLDLPNPLATDVIFLAQDLEGDRIGTQAALDQDVTLARAEPFHGGAQQIPAQQQLLTCPEAGLLVLSFMDEKVLPFGIVLTDS